jgi:predicted nucleic acid-binding protein
MPGKVFIDSNIFIYAKIEQPDSHNHELAKKFLKALDTEDMQHEQLIEKKLKIINPFYKPRRPAKECEEKKKKGDQSTDYTD